MLMSLWQIRSLLKTLLLNVRMGISLALAHLPDNMKPYEGLCTITVIRYICVTKQGNALIFGDVILWETTEDL